MIIPQEVEHAVNQQAAHLLVQPVAVFGRLPLRRRHRNHDITE